MEPTRLLSPARPGNCDLYVGLITSDYQVRVRWGFMGFDNASWDPTCISPLLYKAQARKSDVFPRKNDMRVDVNHWRDRTISGYMVGIEVATAADGARIQADWTTPRPWDYVLAAFALPKGQYAATFAYETFKRYRRVGISIEHGGRKPKRTIGPYVTLTDGPWNKDCWLIFNEAGKYMYPKRLTSKEHASYPVCLPTSIISKAQVLLDDMKRLPIK